MMETNLCTKTKFGFTWKLVAALQKFVRADILARSKRARRKEEAASEKRREGNIVCWSSGRLVSGSAARLLDPRSSVAERE